MNMTSSGLPCEVAYWPAMTLGGAAQVAAAHCPNERTLDPAVCSYKRPTMHVCPIKPAALWPSPRNVSGNDSLFLVTSITRYYLLLIYLLWMLEDRAAVAQHVQFWLHTSHPRYSLFFTIIVSASVLHVIVQHAMTTSSNAPTQVSVSAHRGSVTAIETAKICLMNGTAVSDTNLHFAVC